MNKVSVIISALNEPYLEKTLDVIYQNSNGKIHEIIVIDDNSDVPVTLPWKDVRVIRNQTREGLIRSRDDASKLATGDIIVSVDPHVAVFKDWLTPIIDRLSNNYKCIGVPLTRGLKPEPWIIDGPVATKTAWRWNLDFHWTGDDGTDATPAFAGHCFAFTKKWWEESGGFDRGMYQWGGENIEFSLRTWLAGGSVELIRDSTVAHWFKGGKFTNYTVSGKVLQENKTRIAEVWLDEYADCFYRAINRSRGSVTFGDVSDRLAIKSAIQKRSIKWFLDELMPQLNGVAADQNVFSGSKVAILGSGPSLDHITQSVLDGYDIVIGINYNALVFKCDYVVFHDVKPAQTVLMSGKYQPEQLFVPVKLKDGRKLVDSTTLSDKWKLYELGQQDNAGPLSKKTPPFFHHASTVHTAIHMAAFMGATSVTLYGCDCKIAPDGRSHTSLVNEYRGGRYWPNNSETANYLARIERGYDMIRVAAEQWKLPILRLNHI